MAYTNLPKPFYSKKVFYAYFFTWLLIGLSSNGRAQTVFPGTVTFTSQTQIDNFAAYTIIRGDLVFQGADITNVDSLYRITEVQGSINFAFANSVASLDGFSNLTNVGGEFDLSVDTSLTPNISLTSLNALSNLSSATQFILSRYDRITDVNGLSNLSHARYIAFIDNLRLENLDGLTNIDTLDGLNIHRNSSLKNINGLSGLKYASSLVYLDENHQLSNLDGLSSLTFCGAYFAIQNNDNLANIEGLSNLLSVGRFRNDPQFIAFAIHSNPQLTSLKGLHNLHEMGGGFAIINNQSLEEIDALSQLTRLNSYLYLGDNPVLKDLYGLRNITYIETDLIISNNSSLNNCCGLYNYLINRGSTSPTPQIINNGTDCEVSDILINGPCEFRQSHFLRGSAYLETNEDCLKDGQDFPWPIQLIKAEPGPYFGFTDENGNYQLAVDTGTYTVSLAGLNFDPELCDPNILVSVLPEDTSVVVADLGLKGSSCPDLSVHIGGRWTRRCFPGVIDINYCNNGSFPATQTQLSLKLPEYIEFISANASHRFDADSVLILDIGTINPLQCGQIKLNTRVSCNSVEILGLTQCVEASLSSPDICAPTRPSWSGASLAILANCVNSVNRFVVANVGQEDMLDSVSYWIYADTTLIKTGKLFLNQGDNLEFLIPGSGQSFRIEVDQVPNHPSNTQVSAALEGCVATFTSTTSRGMITKFSPPIRKPEPTFTIDCQQIVGSYDPNDKQVFPRGMGNAGLTHPGSTFQYLVRFQNTGTDTAFNIVILDTLSADLDMNTFQLGGSSHPFSLEVVGNSPSILQFNFENVLLPDSNVNEPGSHGYVKFFINHRSNAPLGTEIENFADIYFDFNPPIRTNTVINTLSDFQAEAIGSINGITRTYHPNVADHVNDVWNAGIRVYPNPVKGRMSISLEGYPEQELLVEWIDIHGQKVLKKTYSIPNSSYAVHQDLPELSPGIYLIQFNKQYSQKILVR